MVNPLRQGGALPPQNGLCHRRPSTAVPCGRRRCCPIDVGFGQSRAREGRSRHRSPARHYTRGSTARGTARSLPKPHPAVPTPVALLTVIDATKLRLSERDQIMQWCEKCGLVSCSGSRQTGQPTSWAMLVPHALHRAEIDSRRPYVYAATTVDSGHHRVVRKRHAARSMMSRLRIYACQRTIPLYHSDH